MRTTIILDTSALIADPSAYLKYKHCDVILPIMVLNELDKLKKFPDEAGKNARVAIRLLDQLTENVQDISQGIMIEEHDICVKFDTSHRQTDSGEYAGFGDESYGDTQILICAKRYFDNHPENDVTLVTNDINLRIKAKSRGIFSSGHNTDNLSVVNDIYSGTCSIEDPEAAMELLANDYIDAGTLGLDLSPHECVQFVGKNNSTLALGRKVGEKIKLIKKSYPWNLSPRNLEQQILVDLIMSGNNPNDNKDVIDLVTCIGNAGTGKSIVTLACALELVINKKAFSKIIVFRPIIPMGNDLGYMKGTLAEKLEPWFYSTVSSLESLMTNNSKRNNAKFEIEMFQKKGQLEFGATYIRGRSIDDAIIIIDECQNISKAEITSILTRCGNNAIILLGDISQIDTAKLDAINNGLTFVINKMKNIDIASHITLVKGERSRLATICTKVL